MKNIIKKEEQTIQQTGKQEGSAVRRQWQLFWQDKRGMGVIEIALIIVILIGLAVIFKKEVTAFLGEIFKKMNNGTGDLLGLTGWLGISNWFSNIGG